MESNKIQNIIVKYLSNQATFSELDELDKWVKNPENEKLFKSYIRTNYAIDYNMKKFDSEKIKMMLSKEIAKEKKVFRLKKIRQRLLYGAAATIIIGVLSVNFFFKDSLFNTPIEKPLSIVNNRIEIGTDKATLTLEDGSVVVLKNGNTFHTQNATSNGKEIVYKTAQQKQTKTAYNYLTIPRGGQFFIKLSDGTQVWLNSESQLKFPVAFVDGEIRQVELVYGEAYFDVSPSTKHKGSKFKVFNKSQEVEVVGTEFNIKAYKDETNVYTTLVEGKVDVSIANTKQRLIPNQQLNLNLKTKASVINSVDVYDEIAWKQGVFSFKRKSLEDIMKVLSRWYDLDVKFTNPQLKKSGFNGIVGKDQKIEDILETIKSYGVIKEYEIKNKTVILK